MSKEDYYKLLGVGKGADEKALKSAYRKLAMQYHPDRNPGDEEAERKFKQVNEAYDVLKDPNKRAAYDRYGHQAFEGGGGGGGHPGGQGFGGFQDIFDEMFGDFMGGGRRGGRRQPRGADHSYRININLYDAFKGKKIDVNVPVGVSCEECSGSGAAKGSEAKICPTCQGHGSIRRSQGIFQLETTCGQCGGKGKVIANPCRKCNAQGHYNEKQNISVNIPAGVDNGARLRVAGKGGAVPGGGQQGDLFIEIMVSEHDLFIRQDADLLCQLPISFPDAALGCEMEVPVIDGNHVKVKIPKATQTGQRLRVAGKGMSIYNSTRRGNLYLELYVETPTELTADQENLLHQLRDLEKNQKQSPKIKKFLDKVKSFLDG